MRPSSGLYRLRLWNKLIAVPVYSELEPGRQFISARATACSGVWGMNDVNNEQVLAERAQPCRWNQAIDSWFYYIIFSSFFFFLSLDV